MDTVGTDRRPYTNVQLLIIVNFLHFISGGLVIPVLSRHIMMNGGNHILATTLHSLVYIVQELSTDLLALFTFEKKFVLTFCFYFCFCCNFILVFYNDCITTSLIKCLLGLSIGVIGASKKYTEATEPNEKHITIYNSLDTVKTAGWIVGTVIGGYMYDCDMSLVSNALVASCLALGCILVLQEMNRDQSPGGRSDSKLGYLTDIYIEKLNQLKEIDFKTKLMELDPFIIQVTFIASFVFYFGRFAFLLGFNYHTSATPTGYITAFEHFLIFFWNCLMPFTKGEFKNHRKTVQHCMAVSAFLLAGMFYAPTLTCHAIFSIPVFYTYTLANALLEDDALGLKEEGMDEAIDTLTVLCNIFIPVFCGILCDVFGGQAYKLFSVLPMIICFLMVGCKLSLL